MKISIGICTCNRAEHLHQTLQSMACVSAPEGSEVELLVVDNASTDNTAAVVESCRLPEMTVRRLYEAQRGLSHARNTALAAAQGQIIAFTDDDVRFQQNWLTGLCAPILEGKADAVAGGVKMAPYLERDWMTPQHRGKLADTSLVPADAPPALVGANMAFSRKILEKVPCFDTELGAGTQYVGEESLFSMQMLEAGFRITRALEVVVEHHFEEDRLLRSRWLGQALRFGWGGAYLLHHWHHAQFNAIRLRLVRKKLQLGLWRARHKPPRQDVEGIPDFELSALQHIHMLNHLLLLRNQPRKYARHGLVKLGTGGR